MGEGEGRGLVPAPQDWYVANRPWGGGQIYCEGCLMAADCMCRLAACCICTGVEGRGLVSKKCWTVMAVFICLK